MGGGEREGGWEGGREEGREGGRVIVQGMKMQIMLFSGTFLKQKFAKSLL